MKEQTIEKAKNPWTRMREWTSCWGRYLSDDQRAVFAGRGARVALAFVVNNHGLHRLGLSVAQPGGPAGEQGGSHSPQTARPARPPHPS